VVNADDWGLDRLTTDRILACAVQGRISTVSAMVFMEDSERAAELAKQNGVCAGLHLNLSAQFTEKGVSAKGVSVKLAERHSAIVKWLRGSRYARGLYHPGLRNEFEYVVKAQLEEFGRLYGGAPQRIDGHHHLHLAPNVLMAKLLPAGTTVRRNFSFRAGEKGALNRAFRGFLDQRLARRHTIMDYFFSIQPLRQRDRLQDIFELAKASSVELETHPALEDEFTFLTGAEMLRMMERVPMWHPAGSLTKQ
jgi:predicted glycoside hydrolase/deacetylase ChbG (UPF0249 family)